MQLDGMEKHEARVRGWLDEPELAGCIDADWQCSGDQVLRILGLGDTARDDTQRREEASDHAFELLFSCLSGPIDIDKLDYLQRDSLHAGVPYGRNFDIGRLISSMCVHPDRWRLAVGEKGRTAAEMMVFSRYVMFSEVYWHHAVRSATAMLQRAVFSLRKAIDWDNSLRLTDGPWIDMMRSSASGTEADGIVASLFGVHRRLYKRVAEFNVIDGHQVHRRLARRPYWWLVACGERLAEQLAVRLGHSVDATGVLIDAPPVKLEVDINIDVVHRDGRVNALGNVSPVAAVLARQQFDDQVKRVRIYVDPDLRDELKRKFEQNDQWGEQLIAAADSLEADLA
jgi:HD superfamily phosphohydrolase